ncbi:MAG: type I 3-dehydroquinate dehydratase [Fibrobacter sp.]|nr:type I 3-dehydroquinate dehydratase [Fibrobacter sp.]
MIKIGDLELGTRPEILAVIDEKIPVREILDLKQQGVGLLEVRVDCFNLPISEILEYVREVRESVHLPIIGTVRETEFNHKSRVDIFRKIIPFVDCIDIELGCEISDEVVKLGEGKTIMVSEHDFTGTPSLTDLQMIVQRALTQGADIIKIAAMADSTEDVRRLLRFTDNSKEPLVTIAMGPVGAVTRLIAPLFGSLFTYGYVNKPVAPGQLSVYKLLEEFHLYYRQ